jgi:hypothetical protein
MSTQMDQYIVENDNWVFRFYVTKQAVTVNW